MTVLRREAAAGFNLGQLGRILGTAVLVGIIAAGVVMAVTNDASPQPSSAAQIEETRAETMVEQYRADWYAQANALNKADIGPATSTRPGEVSDKADQIFYQQAAELTDPADLKFKN